MKTSIINGSEVSRLSVAIQRVLSVYAQNKVDTTDVKYPYVHIAPLFVCDMLEDFFSPIARDGAAMREIPIRLIKGLSMLSHGWPEEFATAARVLACEVREYIEKENYTASDKERVLAVYFNLFPEIYNKVN